MSTVDPLHRQQIVREHPVVGFVEFVLGIIDPVEYLGTLPKLWLVNVPRLPAVSAFRVFVDPHDVVGVAYKKLEFRGGSWVKIFGQIYDVRRPKGDATG